MIHYEYFISYNLGKAFAFSTSGCTVADTGIWELIEIRRLLSYFNQLSKHTASGGNAVTSLEGERPSEPCCKLNVRMI